VVVRPTDRVRLNDEQIDVANIEGALPLKVIAGAGTGKTETLAARFVALVHAGVPPHRILLLTFTEEAAVEMRARVMTRLRESAPEVPPEQLLDLWCHTFHGFGIRLLRQYGWALRLPPTTRVLDEQDQQQVLDELVMRWEDALRHGSYRPLEHASYRWDNGEAWSKALRVLQTMRNSSATPDDLGPHPDLREQQHARFGAEWAQLTPLIEHAYTAFNQYSA
jgi:DNA helicase-2/ATP-dependent DNA helicase PcrA